MSSARDNILRRVAAALDGRNGNRGTGSPSGGHDHPSDASPPRPQWEGALLDRFLDRLQAASASWTGVDTLDAVPTTVVDYLADNGLAPRLRVAPHRLLQNLSWPDQLEITTGTDPQGLDVALSVADAAMAETGTLVLCSGPESPTTLDFLADHHLVVLRREHILPYMEDVWASLRRRPDFPPRSLNYITGPSRTADVEQTMQLGAHGPRSLHVLLIP
ncbi:MAG: LUD domain-containing protein [Ectothiorhodospiraceae bacterium]|nr:LUD domain-containing protein [Ectothiorhodospiraceae bacterium]